jgi:F-type H+-transporting ATPase subunit gamma
MAPAVQSMRRSTIVLSAGCLLVVASWVRTHFNSDVGFVGSTAPSTSERSLQVARFGYDKAMKERIVSVEKTGKLTDAMRLVAAAKVRRSQDGVSKSRPFSDELQGMIKGLVKKLKGSGLEAELPMLRVPEKVKNVGILLVTSNRGLCGAYNSFVVKKTRARIQALNDEGIVPKLMIIGKKGRNALKTRLAVVNLNYTQSWFSMPDTITAKFSSSVGDEVKNFFLSGEVDKVEVIYAKFFNLIKNEPTVRTLLPLSPTGMEDPDDETFRLTSEDGKLKVEKEKVKAVKAKEIEPDVIFDQPPETILNSMLPLYLNSQLLSILFDAQASELSSRMTAMKAATDNAKELQKALTLAFNKKRQAGVTAELSEISAAASSLDSSGDKTAGPGLGVFDNEDTVGDDLMKELSTGSLPDSPPAPAGPDQRGNYDKFEMVY